MSHKTRKPTSAKPAEQRVTKQASPDPTAHICNSVSPSTVTSEPREIDAPCTGDALSQEQKLIYLEPDEYDMIVALLENPPPLNERFSKAIEQARAGVITIELPKECSDEPDPKQ